MARDRAGLCALSTSDGTGHADVSDAKSEGELTTPRPWSCRACGTVLGTVSGGTLVQRVAGRVDRWGNVTVVCPQCGVERLWTRQRAVGASRM